MKLCFFIKRYDRTISFVKRSFGNQNLVIDFSERIISSCLHKWNIIYINHLFVLYFQCEPGSQLGRWRRCDFARIFVELTMTYGGIICRYWRDPQLSTYFIFGSYFATPMPMNKFVVPLFTRNPENRFKYHVMFDILLIYNWPVHIYDLWSISTR